MQHTICQTILDPWEKNPVNYCRPSVSNACLKHFGLYTMSRLTISALYSLAIAVRVISMVNESVSQVLSLHAEYGHMRHCYNVVQYDCTELMVRASRC